MGPGRWPQLPLPTQPGPPPPPHWSPCIIAVGRSGASGAVLPSSLPPNPLVAGRSCLFSTKQSSPLLERAGQDDPEPPTPSSGHRDTPPPGGKEEMSSLAQRDGTPGGWGAVGTCGVGLGGGGTLGRRDPLEGGVWAGVEASTHPGAEVKVGQVGWPRWGRARQGLSL